MIRGLAVQENLLPGTLYFGGHEGLLLGAPLGVAMETISINVWSQV